jgi:hypothetical protein
MMERWRRSERFANRGRVPKQVRYLNSLMQHYRTYRHVRDEMMDIMRALPPANRKSAAEVRNKGAD